MVKQTVPDFIVIDDDPVNNMICRKYIGFRFPAVNILTFTDPLTALDYIHSKYDNPDANKVYLLLDINMPGLSGWGVLDKFTNFSDTIKRHFTIFILSSSVVGKDKQLADENPLVAGFIEKPLTEVQLHTIFSGIDIQN